MKTNTFTFLIKIAVILILAVSLIGSPARTDLAGNFVLASTPAEYGYIDFSYGTAVKGEPTADSQESKIWWNDGFWWGILFDPATTHYMIHSFDWANKSWVKTNTTIDDIRPNNPPPPQVPQIAVRFDTLWDAGSHKLFLVSHIQVENPAQTTNDTQWAMLYRYSYNTGSNTYTLDAGYPVAVNHDRTESVVLDKDNIGRLWVTYVSHPTGSNVYRVYVNFSTSTTDHTQWNATPFELTSYHPGATNLNMFDVSSMIAFGGKVGILWSNEPDGRFYFAEHLTNDSDPTAHWTVTPVNIPGVPLVGNGHIKLVANSDGQVFASLKTNNVGPQEPLVGVLVRDGNGAFSFLTVSNVPSFDTRPTMALDETGNRLLLFYVSNEAGGLICYKSIPITNPGSNMTVTQTNCSDNPANNGNNFLVSSAHPNINNPTTSKRNVTGDMGLLVLASDDINGQVYVQNTMNLAPFTVKSRVYLPIVNR